METKTRMFIISFGESRKYKVTVSNKDGSREFAPVVRAEKVLNAYLAKKFPGNAFAYFTTPRMTEVDPAHADKYATYPDFDSAALEEIKAELVREIQVMEHDKHLDRDAPWASVN